MNSPGQMAFTVMPWGAQSACEVQDGGLAGFVVAAANSSVSNQGADGRDVDDAPSMTLCHHRRANDFSGKKAAR
jgi:hypothetical protein